MSDEKTETAGAEESPEYQALVGIRELLAREHPWLRPVRFSGPKGIFEKREDRGPSALSFGIYNPVKAKIYLGLFGASANERDGGFPVPAESVLILPIEVPAELEIGIDAAELGAGNEATIYAMRFRTVQPFFLGAL